MLGIADQCDALNFDLACNLRLIMYDEDKRLDEFKALAIILGGDPGGGEPQEVEGGAEEW